MYCGLQGGYLALQRPRPGNRATSAPTPLKPGPTRTGEVKYCIAKLFSNGVKFATANDF
jgi:hypothetical protein